MHKERVPSGTINKTNISNSAMNSILNRYNRTQIEMEQRQENERRRENIQQERNESVGQTHTMEIARSKQPSKSRVSGHEMLRDFKMATTSNLSNSSRGSISSNRTSRSSRADEQDKKIQGLEEKFTAFQVATEEDKKRLEERMEQERERYAYEKREREERFYKEKAMMEQRQRIERENFEKQIRTLKNNQLTYNFKTPTSRNRPNREIAPISEESKSTSNEPTTVIRNEKVYQQKQLNSTQMTTGIQKTPNQDIDNQSNIAPINRKSKNPKNNIGPKTYPVSNISRSRIDTRRDRQYNNTRQREDPKQNETIYVNDETEPEGPIPEGPEGDQYNDQEIGGHAKKKRFVRINSVPKFNQNTPSVAGPTNENVEVKNSLEKTLQDILTSNQAQTNDLCNALIKATENINKKQKG